MFLQDYIRPNKGVDMKQIYIVRLQTHSRETFHFRADFSQISAEYATDFATGTFVWGSRHGPCLARVPHQVVLHDLAEAILA